MQESRGHYSAAEHYCLEAKTIQEATLGKAHPDYAQTLNNLALLYIRIGEPARALPLLTEAKGIYKQSSGELHPDYAAVLHNLGEVSSAMANRSDAEAYYIEAAAIMEQTLGKSHPERAKSLSNLAKMYLSSDDFLRAEPLYLEARRITESTLGKQHPQLAAALNNLAMLRKLQGNYADARKLSQEANEIYRTVLGPDHPEYALGLNNLATLFRIEHQFTDAERIYLQGHRVLCDAAVNTIPALSDAQTRSWMRENRPRADLVLAMLRRQMKWSSPLAYVSIWETKGMASRLRIGSTLPNDASAEAQAAFGQLRDARLRLASLVASVPSIEQAEQYRLAFAQANEVKERLEQRVAELSPATKRELAVRDTTTADLLSLLPPGVAVVDFVRMDDWEDVDVDVRFESEDGTFKTRSVKREQATRVYDAFILRSDRHGEQTSAEWVPLGPAAPIDLAIGAWRLQLTGEQGNPRDPEDQSIPGSATDNVTAGRELRERIWEKLEPQLAGCHTIILLPDGDLHRVPWAALPGRDGDSFLIEDYALAVATYGQQLFGLLSEDPPTGDPTLLIAGGIDYDNLQEEGRESSQATDSFAQRDKPAGRQNAGLWTYLEGTTREAGVVQSLWSDFGHVRRFSGDTAGESTVSEVMTKSRFVHLATHGFFEQSADVYQINLRQQPLFQTDTGDSQPNSTVGDRNPLLMTGIVLSGANVDPVRDGHGLPIGSDGILTAEEIQTLDLHETELITLSACETALGDVAAGEGVFGLSRALHSAGARSVLSSLWKVDDAATVALMTEFYTNLWQKKMGKVEALRQAQLTMIRDYDPSTNTLRRGLGTKPGKVATGKKPGAAKETSDTRLDPALWAAFQLSGDWR